MAGKVFGPYANLTKPVLNPFPDLLRIVVGHQPPFVYVDRTKVGNDRFQGALVDMLPLILNYSGVSALVKGWTFYEAPVNTGGQLDIGTNVKNYTGIVGELVAGRADLALFPLAVTSATRSAVDITAPFMDSGQAILVVATDSTLGPDIFLKPFSEQLWVILLSAMIGMSFMFWLIDRLTRSLKPSYTRRARDKSSHFFESWLAFTQNVLVPRNASWSLQLIYTVLCFFCFIVFQAYQAQLNALLTNKRLGVSVTSILDVYAASLPFGVEQGSVVESYFRNSRDFIAKGLKDHMVPCANMDACVQMLRAGKISAVFNYRALLQEAINIRQECDLQIVGSDYTPGTFTLALPLNSSLTPMLAQGLLQVRELGDANMVLRRWQHGNACKLSTVTSQRLDIPDAVYPYTILVATAGGAVLWVLWEYFLLPALLNQAWVQRLLLALASKRVSPSGNGTQDAFDLQAARQSSGGLSMASGKLGSAAMGGSQRGEDPEDDDGEDESLLDPPPVPWTSRMAGGLSVRLEPGQSRTTSTRPPSSKAGAAPETSEEPAGLIQEPETGPAQAGIVSPKQKQSSRQASGAPGATFAADDGKWDGQDAAPEIQSKASAPGVSFSPVLPLGGGAGRGSDGGAGVQGPAAPALVKLPSDLTVQVLAADPNVSRSRRVSLRKASSRSAGGETTGAGGEEIVGVDPSEVNADDTVFRPLPPKPAPNAADLSDTHP